MVAIKNQYKFQGTGIGKEGFLALREKCPWSRAEVKGHVCGKQADLWKAGRFVESRQV